MSRDYDWDLESPIDDPLSVDRNLGPKYDDELRELYRVMRLPPSVDSRFDPSRDSREIDEWEKMVEMATYQFLAVPEVVGTDQDNAEKLFDTGELLVYKLLDDFDDFHVNYYDQFITQRDAEIIDDLRNSYQEAYDVIDELDDDDSIMGSELGSSAGDEGLGGSISDEDDLGGSIGGGDIGGGDI